MSYVIDVLRALVDQAATTLPESNYALRHARRALIEHDTETSAPIDRQHPWGVAYDRPSGMSYAWNFITGERAPLRSHPDSAVADAQERNNPAFGYARALLAKAHTRFSGSGGGSAAATQAETPKETRSRYTRYIYELNREQLEHLLRCLPVPTYAATVEALRGAAVNHFRWGGISIADIDEARKL